MTKLHTHFIDKIHSVPANEWNAVAGTDYPFMRHEFLAAMEESGSVSPEAGWTPSHLIIRDDNEKLVAVMPCYVKENSYGEYVFDWSWANAYHQNGLPYYPKLLTAIPFTPCVGPRLAAIPAHNNQLTVQVAIEAILERCKQEKYSSWHLLFPKRELVKLIQNAKGANGREDENSSEAEENDCGIGVRLGDLQKSKDLMRRVGSQFHWYNRGYVTFDDYLDAMTSRKRKSVRKEREKVTAQGISFLHVNGQDISPQLLDEFYVFYHATYMKRGQHGYLNRECFELLVQEMPENLHFVFARKRFTEDEQQSRQFFWRTEDGEAFVTDEEESIAAALFLQGGDTIYGRYWGCLDEFDHLHFETCYYQGIDYCIKEGVAHFDAGAQGEHKIQRGFEPIETYSFHWIAHPGFRDAVEDFLNHEEKDVRSYIQDAASYLPFKKGDG